MKSLFAISISLLIGCSGSDGIHYTFQASPEDELATQKAINLWSICRVVEPQLTDDGDVKIIVAPELAVSGYATMNAIMLRGRGEAEFYVILHEMGHIFGMKHEGKGIMSADMGDRTIGDFECNMLRNRTTFYVNNLP